MTLEQFVYAIDRRLPNPDINLYARYEDCPDVKCFMLRQGIVLDDDDPTTLTWEQLNRDYEAGLLEIYPVGKSVAFEWKNATRTGRIIFTLKQDVKIFN